MIQSVGKIFQYSYSLIYLYTFTAQKAIHLEEDLFLNGFVPLPLIDYQICDSNISAKEKEQFIVRIAKVASLGKIFLQHASNLGNIAIATDSKLRCGNIELSTFEEVSLNQYEWFVS